MKAIISDIHGNLEALRAVFQDIINRNVREVYCLGDIVGYGPDPRECVDRVMGCKLVLRGNHDDAVLKEPIGFNATAAASLRWTRSQLECPEPSAEASERRRKFLAGLPLSHVEGDLLFVHGSPRCPLTEYVFPEDVDDRDKMNEIFKLFPRCCFTGHTHVPGIFTQNRRFYPPEDIRNIYKLDAKKVLCNVGSVGQPRDGGWRASYVLLDGDNIQFRQVSYDVDATIAKVRAIPDLEPLVLA
jgi:predicted phosphodiesterase